MSSINIALSSPGIYSPRSLINFTLIFILKKSELIYASLNCTLVAYHVMCEHETACFIILSKMIFCMTLNKIGAAGWSWSTQSAWWVFGLGALIYLVILFSEEWWIARISDYLVILGLSQVFTTGMHISDKLIAFLIDFFDKVDARPLSMTRVDLLILFEHYIMSESSQLFSPLPSY